MSYGKNDFLDWDDNTLIKAGIQALTLQKADTLYSQCDFKECAAILQPN